MASYNLVNIGSENNLDICVKEESYEKLCLQNIGQFPRATVCWF